MEIVTGEARLSCVDWIPACAGMTGSEVDNEFRHKVLRAG